MNQITAILIDASAKATILLALACLALRLFRNRSAAARHLLLTSSLCAALLLPAITLLAPAWHVRGIPQIAANTDIKDIPAATTWQNQNGVARGGVEVPSAAGENLREATKSFGSSRSAVHIAPAATQRSTHRAASVIPSAPTPSSFAPANAPAPTTTRNSNVNWNQLLLIAWITGAALLFGRFLLGKLRLFKLVRKAAPLGDPVWRNHMQQVAASLGIRRPVELFESHDTDVPLAAGAVRPKVVLSADYAEWSPLRRDAVLQHELAHIKRLDTLTQFIARLACAVYWFHPLVWIAVRAMKAECERACDDYVLAAGTKPSEYAHELLEIASSLRHPELNAALAMARRSQLEGRVLALLNPAVVRGSVSRKMMLAAAVITICIVLPLAAIQAAGPQKTSAPAGNASAEAPAVPGTPSQATAHTALPAPPAAPDSATTPAVPAQPMMTWSEPETAPAPVHAAPPAIVPPAPAAFAGQPAPAAEAPPAPALAHQNAPAMAPPPPPPSAPLAPVAVHQHGDSSGIEGCNGSGKHTSNVQIDSDNGHRKWIASWSGDDCQVDLHAEGEIHFNAEATALESISSGGYFEVNERRGAELRHVRVTPSGNGLQYEYKVNGTQQQFDQKAREWFSRFLLSLERTTGFAADSRVPMLLKKGGPQAVLDEIGNLQTDYVRGVYFRKLLDQPDLPAPVVTRIITQAGEQIKTDYEMARVLMEVAGKYPMKDEASRSAFLTAANHLKTDYEHSRVLITLLKMPNLSKENIRMALESAATIKTDYEKSRILVTLAELKSFDENEVSTYLKLVPEIHTDYEKSRSLIALMQSHNISSASVSKMLEATSSIHTDYEKSRILVTLAGMSKFDETQIGSYLNVVDSIGTDYERSRSLLAMMDKNKLSPAAVTRILDTTSHIHGDYEKSRVLLTVANKYPLDGALREKYISTANSIGSEYERNRALAAVAKRAAM